MTNNKEITLTKPEWAKLGINDSNADFERVEEISKTRYKPMTRLRKAEWHINKLLEEEE